MIADSLIQIWKRKIVLLKITPAQALLSPVKQVWIPITAQCVVCVDLRLCFILPTGSGMIFAIAMHLVGVVVMFQTRHTLPIGVIIASIAYGRYGEYHHSWNALRCGCALSRIYFLHDEYARLATRFGMTCRRVSGKLTEI